MGIDRAGKDPSMIRALAFGGAFNPPTIAHVELAHIAMEAAGAACVIFVPSKMTYILDEQGKNFSFTDIQRLEMLERIASHRPWMRLSSYEISSPLQPRTYDTLCHLRNEGYDVSLLFGSDKLPELETVWRHVDDICAEFGIVCLSRSGEDTLEMIYRDPYLTAHRKSIIIVETPKEYQEISSSRVRHLILELHKCAGESDDRSEDLRRELSSLICPELNNLEEWRH